MFQKQLDFLAIGDITTDAFIRLKEAHVNCRVDNNTCELCMKFADKIPYEFMEEVPAVGNSANASVSASRLGLNSALVANIGDDDNGKKCLTSLKKDRVNPKYVKVNRGKQTNYHYVLWYGDERTILVKHQEYEYNLPKIGDPKWLYLSSLGGASENYHNQIIEYLKSHPKVKLAFQPGTFQMKLGIEKLRPIYERTNVFVCNVGEAKRILGKDGETKSLLTEIANLGPKLVWITDGPKGAYFYDGTNAYFMPPYPDPKPPYERTGAGDAFASTFVSATALGKTNEEAAKWAMINSMSVVQSVGAQKGLLNQAQIVEWLSKSPQSFHLTKI